MKPSKEAVDEAAFELLGLKHVDLAISVAQLAITVCDIAIREVREADAKANAVRVAESGPTLEVACAMEREAERLENQLRALRGAAQSLHPTV